MRAFAYSRLGRVLASAAALSFLFFAPVSARSAPKARSRALSYTHEELPEGPWSTYVLKFARTNHNLEFCTSMGNGTSFGMSAVSDQVRTIDPQWGEPIAAINGDFFNRRSDFYGRPRGLQIRHGELVNMPDPEYACFWLDANGEPRAGHVEAQFEAVLPGGKRIPMGLNIRRGSGAAVLYTSAAGASTRASGFEIVLERNGADEWLPLKIGKSYKARVRETSSGGNTPLRPEIAVLSTGGRGSGGFSALKPGDVIELRMRTSPELSDVSVAIGGGPMLVENGKPERWSGYQRRHPRTAFGWNNDYFFFVEVDGRQLESVGMTFPELASYMAKLGCTCAINFDGGGSSTFWLYGNVINEPSEGRERPAPNALILLEKHKVEPGNTSEEKPSETCALPSAAAVAVN